MTDTQLLGALSGAVLVAAGVVRWAVKLLVDGAKKIVDRVLKSMDDNAAANRRVIEENTASHRARVDAEHQSVQRLTALEAKVGEIHDWVVDHTPVRGVPIFDPDPVPTETPSERRRRERGTNGYGADLEAPSSYHVTRRK